MQKRQGSGFSLIELIVVTAVISLLAAILLPVLKQARDTAQRTPCTANLHQIAQAFTVYFDDNDQIFPPCGLSLVQSPADLDTLWFRQIAPYLKSQAVLHCPADHVRNAQRTFSAAMPEAWDQPGFPALSYGANWNMMNAAFRRVPQANVAALPAPALTLLVADCTEPWAFGPVYRDLQGVRWSHIAYANGPPVAVSDTLLHGGRSGMGHERHGTGSLIAYFDGHVAFLPAERFYNVSRFVVTTSTGKGISTPVQRPILFPNAISPE